MRPELQVAVCCAPSGQVEPGVCSLGGPSRSRPSPRSCPARREPHSSAPCWHPSPLHPAGDPRSFGAGGRGQGLRAVIQSSGLRLSWHWALQESGCLPPGPNAAPLYASATSATCHPAPASGSRNSTRAGRQAAHTPWGSDASGGRGLEHTPCMGSN